MSQTLVEECGLICISVYNDRVIKIGDKIEIMAKKRKGHIMLVMKVPKSIRVQKTEFTEISRNGLAPHVRKKGYER